MLVSQDYKVSTYYQTIILEYEDSEFVSCYPNGVKRKRKQGEYSSTHLIPNKHVNKEPMTSLSLGYRTLVMHSFHKSTSVIASVSIL
jgi:hypothetical protein